MDVIRCSFTEGNIGSIFDLVEEALFIMHSLGTRVIMFCARVQDRVTTSVDYTFDHHREGNVTVNILCCVELFTCF